MTYSKLLNTISIAARIASIGASAVLWYYAYKYIYKQSDDDSEYGIKGTDDYSDCYKIIRMKIPSYSKGAIIGKSGSTIKRIQEKTKTTIKFVGKGTQMPSTSGDNPSMHEWTVDATKESVGDAFEILLIRGLTLRVMEAEKEIKSLIESVPVYTVEEMQIENRFVGKIIGKKGENVRRLKDLYKVQIDIDKNMNNSNVLRQVFFRGISENIAECKSEIIKMIDAELLKEKRFNHQPNIRTQAIIETESNSVQPNELIPPIKIDIAMNRVVYPGKLLERVPIYVSSVVDCSRFYAQILSDDLSKLEQIIEEMTEHFSKVPFDHQTSFNVDDIVAAFYDPSQTWQRVKINLIEKEQCEITYLDYGDCAIVKLEDLRPFEKDTKYLELPFQAVPLITYGIKPCGEQWTEDDIKEFEHLTKEKITAVLKNNSTVNTEVQLLDEENGFDVAERLIAIGRAKRTI